MRSRTVVIVTALLGLLLAGLAAPQAMAKKPRPQTVDWVAAQYTLPPGSMEDPQGVTNDLRRNLEPPCDDCDIIGVEPDLTDTEGNSVNVDTGPMLHHMVLYEQGAADASCPGPIPAFGMKRLFATGNERTEIPTMRGYGLNIGAGTKLAVLSDVMNHAPREQTVQVRLKVTHVPGGTQRPVTPIWLDVTECGFSYMDVPEGKSSQQGYWDSTIEGNIIGLGGHVHEHGTNITATNVSRGRELCDSKATMDEHMGHHWVSDMSICVGRVGKLRPGDRIRVESFYDTPHAIQGAMGIMLMYVHEK